MSLWSDLAVWRGPTVNQGGPMRAYRGLVIHIAEGFFEGTISWQRNPSSQVSSHFIVGRDGAIAQMVDTDVVAWTQQYGNGSWLSVENEGFTPDPLTPAQVEANAQLFARGFQEYGWPLGLAADPSMRGLGHHSMGCNWPGGAWGHCDCPGPAIIAQKGEILARAIDIVGGDMNLTDRVNLVQVPGVTYGGGATTSTVGALLAGTYAYTLQARNLSQAADAADAARDAAMLAAIQALTAGGSVDAAPIVDAIRQAADETRTAVLDALQARVTALETELAAYRAAAAAGAQAQADALRSAQTG